MSFNSEHEFIEEQEMNRLKDKFQEANKKSHVMYQDVVSFDNQFLKDNHLFNESLDKLDEPKIKKATRRMVNQMIKDNKMDKDHTFWCANIHYDTDNIHIHIATLKNKIAKLKYDYLVLFLHVLMLDAHTISKLLLEK
ncbi:hypothetical protein HMPREF9975_01189 [Staphylococcus epidermidis NIHLM001]|nr:relaxase MobL [Staphylococcus epidermidis]EJE26573.1 hypothetical protein HMPREF9975_01189 [Staphylococcus epidermidis NIHLM001]MCO6259958.1 relaxase MobL [Staphylococcus epidermidis]